MNSANLFGIYNSTIRPSVEYASIIYHPLIPEYLSNKLEQVQKQAVKIILGHNVDYAELVKNGELETLKDRRIEASLRFATKAANSPRFGPIWFKEAQFNDREVRSTTRLKYVEPFCRTERSRNNPLNYMTRLLNEHLGT